MADRNQIIEKIKQWITEVNDGSIERLQTPEFPPDYFVFKVTVVGKAPIASLPREGQPQGKVINIAYLIDFPNKGDLLRITISVSFNQLDNTSFKLLVLEDKVKFVNRLTIPVMTLNLNYTWQPNLINFESLQLFKVIYYDGFSKNTFFDSVSAVIHGYQICAALFQEFIKEIGEKRD